MDGMRTARCLCEQHAFSCLNLVPQQFMLSRDRLCTARIFIKILIISNPCLLLNPYGHQKVVWRSAVMVAQRKVMCSDDYDTGDEDGDDGDGNSHHEDGGGNSHDEDGDGNGDDVA